MREYIVHFRDGGFQIVEAENKQDAMSQIDLSIDIDSCWEYEGGGSVVNTEENRQKELDDYAEDIDQQAFAQGRESSRGGK